MTAAAMAHGHLGIRINVVDGKASDAETYGDWKNFRLSDKQIDALFSWLVAAGEISLELPVEPR